MFFWKSDNSVSWIAVFLGNPGLRYENTRHNVGFIVADVIADARKITINRMKWSALTTTTKLGGDSALLLKPQTYMNLSGNSVRQAMKFYKVPLDRVIVIFDDVSLPVGKLRIRRSGSAGGHNGIKDIIAKCGGDDFPRIRIGVGSIPNSEMDMADWVLSKFSDSDKKTIKDSAQKAATALEMIIESGVDSAMAKFN